jgi:DegV family protein with EDD domain
MASVAIVSDTTHYAPQDLVAERGIHQVSLYVNDGDTQRRESDMPDFSAFYGRLQTSADLPTTSQPSIGDFLEVYEPLVEAGHDVVSVHLSGGISGTVESAHQAAADVMQRIPGRRIEVVDSGSVCGGMAYVLFATAAAARSGGDVERVAARGRDAADVVRIWFAVDTLEFLRRGGRIGAAQAWLGSALKIKPILTLTGEVTPIERVRTSGRAFERLVEYMHEMRDAGSDGWIVQHIRAPERADRLVERGREVFGCDPLFVSEMGPVIGTHGGPGVLGIGGGPASLLR